MEDFKLFVEIIMASGKKNDIVSIKEKSNDHISEIGVVTSNNIQSLL